MTQYDRVSLVRESFADAKAGTSQIWGEDGIARYVVAVYPDPDAPILKQADAAIVGDPAKVARELAEALSKN